MRHTKIKQFVLLLGLLSQAVWCNAVGTSIIDGHSHIAIKAANVQGMPKGSTIHASIDEHTLTVVFTESLGQLVVEVTTASGAPVDGTLPAKRKTNEF